MAPVFTTVLPGSRSWHRPSSTACCGSAGGCSIICASSAACSSARRCGDEGAVGLAPGVTLAEVAPTLCSGRCGSAPARRAATCWCGRTSLGGRAWPALRGLAREGGAVRGGELPRHDPSRHRRPLRRLSRPPACRSARQAAQEAAPVARHAQPRRRRPGGGEPGGDRRALALVPEHLSQGHDALRAADEGLFRSGRPRRAEPLDRAAELGHGAGRRLHAGGIARRPGDQQVHRPRLHAVAREASSISGCGRRSCASPSTLGPNPPRAARRAIAPSSISVTSSCP